MKHTPEQICKWEQELIRLHDGSRWGESRRFAGRSAGIRLNRIDWLYKHISESKTNKATGKEG